MKQFLGIAILLLLTLALVTPASAIPQYPTPTPSRTGSIIYVGGSGPDNITTIQAAINTALPGDTIYIYDDAAPYHENLQINKTLTLIGENQTTTLVNGTGLFLDTATITADGVILQNLTIGDSPRNGVAIQASHTLLSAVTVQNCHNTGIDICRDGYTPYQANTIQAATVANNGDGIHIKICNHTVVTHSLITGNTLGIKLERSFNSNISFNRIQGNTNGVELWYCSETAFYHNAVTNSDHGIEEFCATGNSINANNIFNNVVSARFTRTIDEINALQTAEETHDFFFLDNYQIFSITRWDANYWGAPVSFCPIIGFNTVISWVPLLAKIRLRIDWHPAQEPYII